MRIHRTRCWASVSGGSNKMRWDDAKMVGFDVETSGTLREYALQPWRVAQGHAWLTCFATAQKVEKAIVFGGGLGVDVPALRTFLETCIANQWRVVGWNLVFDIQWLIAYGLGDLVFQIKWLDGMLLWKHLTVEPEYELAKHKKKSYGLKACVAEVLPQFAGYEDDIDFHSTDPAELQKLNTYCRRDTVFALRLTKHWYQQLEANPTQLRAALIEAECLPLVAQANLEGMVVDVLAARELQQYLLDIASRTLAALESHGVTETIVRSPTKLATLLFDEWELPVLKENTGKKTKKVTRSTDKEVLHELSFVDDRVAGLRLYRGALNNETKFAKAPLASVAYNGDERSHPAAIVFGTYTGRLTYSSKQGKNKDERQTGFALHQEKRGKEFRSIILPPDGYTLMEFDASGQEFRWMAIAAQDPTMLELCEPGEDPHSYMGARIAHVDYRALMADVHAGVPLAKEQRQSGKVGNLSLQFRISAKRFRVTARVQYNMNMELPEAMRIRATYLQTYRRVPRYWDEQIALTRRRGWVETFAGRRVQVVGNWSGDRGWSMESTSINYRIQGTGADQKYLALAVLRPYLVKIGARFAWDLHDGIYLYVPHHQVERAKHEIPQLLLNLPYRKAWGFQPPIPLPWDCKVGHSWGTLREE